MNAPGWRSERPRTGTSKAPSRRVTPTFPASLATLDGKRLASGRDFDANTGALSAGADVTLLSEEDAVGARCSSRRPAVHRSVGRGAHRDRTTASTVHHVDAPTGGGAQARLQRGAHHARRAGPLRARPHHLHANRLDVARASGDRRGAWADPPHVRRRLPARSASYVSQQGEERAGGARGDPSGR